MHGQQLHDALHISVPSPSPIKGPPAKRVFGRAMLEWRMGAEPKSASLRGLLLPSLAAPDCRRAGGFWVVVVKPQRPIKLLDINCWKVGSTAKSVVCASESVCKSIEARADLPQRSRARGGGRLKQQRPRMMIQVLTGYKRCKTTNWNRFKSP